MAREPSSATAFLIGLKEKAEEGSAIGIKAQDLYNNTVAGKYGSEAQSEAQRWQGIYTKTTKTELPYIFHGLGFVSPTRSQPLPNTTASAPQPA